MSTVTSIFQSSCRIVRIKGQQLSRLFSDLVTFFGDHIEVRLATPGIQPYQVEQFLVYDECRAIIL